MQFNIYRTEQETTALLASQIEDPRALGEAVAVRAAYWRHSGILQPGQRQEVVVGSAVDLVCRVGIPRRSWHLVRKPPGSRIEINDYRLTPDQPGVYHVELHLAGFWRAVEIVAVPQALLDRIGSSSGINDRVISLRSRLNDPNWTTDALIRALESTPAEWGGLAAPTH